MEIFDYLIFVIYIIELRSFTFEGCLESAVHFDSNKIYNGFWQYKWLTANTQKKTTIVAEKLFAKSQRNQSTKRNAIIFANRIDIVLFDLF